MFSIISKSRKLGLSLDLQLDLFDHMVVPIVLYGAEIWGYENINLIEKLNLRFCRLLLNANVNTCRCMIYGELGRRPMNVLIKSRMVSYWAKILISKGEKLNRIMYSLLHQLDKNNIIKSDWLLKIKEILNECGLYNLWIRQQVDNCNNLGKIVKEKLSANFESEWIEELNNSPKCYTYRIFKTKFQLEPYLLKLPFVFRKQFTKFRICNHKLPIEKDRYLGIDRQDRICHGCNVLGDEFHYLFDCIQFSNERIRYLSKYYYNRPNTQKFEILFSTTNINKLRNLSKFVQIIMSVVK